MTFMRHIVVAFLLHLSCWLGYAQSFQVETYSEDDGLNLGGIVDIGQDGDGQMWFSCAGGLLVYNGSEMTHLTGKQAPSKKCDYLSTDKEGNIWASSLSGEAPVFKYEKNQWTALPPLLAYKAFGGEPHGFELIYFKGETVPVLSPSSGGVWYFYRNSWHSVGPEDGLTKGISLISPANDTLYIANNRRLLALTVDGLDDSLTQLIPPEFRDLEALSAEADEQGLIRIWLLGKEWLGVLEGGQFRFLAKVPRIPSVYFGSRVTMLPDERGGVFFGYTLYGYHLRLDDPIVRPIGTSSGLGSDGVVSYFKDREHNIWISGLHGISKISSMRFANYDKKQGLPGDEVTSFAQWSDTEILFGQGSGFSIYDGLSFRILKMNLPTNELLRPFFLRHGPDDAFWVPAIGIGILRITRDEKVTLLTDINDVDGRQVLDVLPFASGETWVGTDNGLRMLKNGKLVPFEPAPPQDLLVRRFLVRANGDIALASQNSGVWEWRQGTWFSYPFGTADEGSITALWENRKNQLFVGTGEGVYRAEGDTLKPYLVDGDLKRVVYFLLEDPKERLWVGTDHGVFVKDGSTVRQFTYRHGLIGVETNRGGGFVDRTGNIWIGTDRGASRYQEVYDDREPAPPLLKINAVEISGKSYDPNLEVTLDHDRNDFIFSFRALSFINEDTLSYQSRLEGYDSQWLPEYRSESRGYRYTNLPPGDYRFHIRARSGDSGWSKEETTARFRILKPFWSRNWFILFAILLVGIVGYSTFDYLSSKRHSRFLENQVEARTQELSTKTDELELQIAASREAERQIQALNEELEKRVLDRTSELEAAQRDLVENAHYAGMAEIANSILHNVGNILNSVSTSGYLIRQTVTESKMASILRANELLAENQERLAEFLVEDPRGKQLFSFYLSLGEVFKRDRERLTKHANLLIEKIDTIKDVVAQQHNYASGIYQNEALDPSEIVETSIKIIENGLTMQNIDLVRDFEPNLCVSIQKTKFIHTLVNLLKNAKESIIASKATGAKRISVRIRAESGFAVIKVKDTGMGILPENLCKVFNHGFTTKQHGHGFGLHSCANAINEMAGSISAESEGSGKGATFVIRLPLIQQGNGQK